MKIRSLKVAAQGPRTVLALEIKAPLGEAAQ